jgi:O-antigen/teichoic acid export membrane protein
LLVISVLILGGRVRATLIAQACAVFVVFLAVWRTLRPVGVGRLSVERGVLRALLVGGTPFVIFNLSMVLQPNIDAVFLSKLAPLEVMGWFAAARRLIGVLLFPAAALIGALYPTLCRLHESSPANFKRTAAGALHGVGLLAVPITLGCALYPDVGVSIFGEEGFGPAADNLRVLSVYLFLVYFSMPLGTILIAAGRQRAWTIVQSLRIVISVALDPILIPWFQSRTGNGGMGPCVVTGISEAIAFVGGLLLLPSGVLDRGLARAMFMAILSGGAMAGTAYLLRQVSPFVAAPLSVLVYAIGLWASGGIRPEQMAMLTGFFRRKFQRQG